MRYLVVFNGVMAEALSLPETLWDLLCVAIWVDTSIEGQVPVYLGEGLRTVHVGLPYRATGLGTVTALMIDWACRGKTQEHKENHIQSISVEPDSHSFHPNTYCVGSLDRVLPLRMNGDLATCLFLSRMWM